MNWRAPVPPRLLAQYLGLVLGVAALGLQFWLSMSSMLGNGRDLPGALGNFFSYYTILTNLGLVLIYLAETLPRAPLDLFRRPLVRGLMLASIALVSLFVFFVLRFQYQLEGLWKTADDMLHYLCPALYLIWWLLGPHGSLAWRNLPVMLAPTLVYFLYILARGAWVTEYPYAVIDVAGFGYGQVLLNAVYMTALLAALCLVTIGLDQWLARSPRTIRS